MRRIICTWRIYSTIYTLMLIMNSESFSITKYMLPCPEELLIGSEKILFNELYNSQKIPIDNLRAKYLASVGLKGNHHYCAAAQYYCFAEACRRNNIPYSDIPLPKTGLARKMLSYASSKGVKVQFTPHRNDLLVWRLAGSSWRGHIERIVEIYPAGWVKTIGFNVSRGTKKGRIYFMKRNIYHPVGKLIVAGLIGFGEVRE